MIQEFHDWVHNRHDRIEEWKKENKRKVFGYLCCVAPEELIHAAGILPVKLTGSDEPISVVDRHVVHYACPYVRSILDLAGRGVYDYLDGVVTCNTCDIMSRCEYYWRVLSPREKSTILGVEMSPYVLYIKHPEKISGKGVREFLKQEYRIFKQHLEREQKIIIDDDRLSRTVDIYNEHYYLMEEFRAYRKEEDLKVSGLEAFEVEFSSLLMPKEEHNRLMESYLGELSEREPLPDRGLRLLLSGGGIDQFTSQIYRIIEECGGQVVAEDIGVSTSYFCRKIDNTKDPLDAIVEHRLGVHCPHTMTEDRFPNERFEYIKKVLDGNRIQGVIFFVPLYCECRNLEYPKLKEDLREEFDVPTLYLDNDYSHGGLEEAHSRIEAFIEMISG
nr:2-hydroxyacyl-CoA dehydratase [Desulfobacterales bacterium]